ncbi:flagellum-specific ATP synthase [Planctomicrobium piriforme]|uniref:Flagellum-specific ATP synthase n=1 Tax=Planctomicrobium piriforme TaxID=1576369 RepID=A0A1I3GRT7_9PLAN|nr:flagellum-specific ATP synthase [Planctomicrobium piriforme]
MQELLTARLTGSIGELCEIRTTDDQRLLAEVVGVQDDQCQIMSFHHSPGLRPGCEVIAMGHAARAPVGPALLGRVVNGLGQPIDLPIPLSVRRWKDVQRETPAALLRQRITAPLSTGQRVIDGLLTLGRGQRVGLFAGSGVGKSTLLGEIAKHASADLNVICLVGERGREVLPFLEDCLGEEGRSRSVVVVATSDETPLMRIQAVRTATAIADDFRSRGANVLFFLDSLTRLAFAQRELGLLRGEPPGNRGYPPSVFGVLASTLEKLGNDEVGSITGLITVLVDGDDMDEPIADAARSILDGHIVLDRKLAAQGHYPAVNVLHSVSRLFREVTTPEHQKAAQRVRQILATHKEVADLIQMGMYQKGASPQIDEAIQMMPHINAFLKQEIGQSGGFDKIVAELVKLSATPSASAK